MEYRARVLIPGVDLPDTADFYRDGPKGHEPLNKTALREAERKYKSKSSDLVCHQPILAGHISLLYDSSTYHSPDYLIPGKDGFHYYPNLIPFELQISLIREILYLYANPTHESNLDPFYHLPPLGIFKDLNELIQPKDPTKPPVLAKDLWPKLRWITLGYRYNWSSKTYNFAQQPPPVPSTVQNLFNAIASAFGYPHYQAQAGIINFYQPNDSLTSHVDRSEPNMEAPLISLSLGCQGIFLLGGVGRDDPVHALKLSSGDVNILSGPSRRFFHGIPRIIPQTFDASGINLPPQVAHFLSHTRINLNIRQVHFK